MQTIFQRFALTNVALNSDQPDLHRTTDIVGISPIINPLWSSRAFCWIAVVMTLRCWDRCCSIHNVNYSSMSGSLTFLSAPGRYCWLLVKSKSWLLHFFSSYTHTQTHTDTHTDRQTDAHTQTHTPLLSTCTSSFFWALLLLLLPVFKGWGFSDKLRTYCSHDHNGSRVCMMLHSNLISNQLK